MRDAADLGRHPVEDVADVLGLVVGGDRGSRSCPRKRSGSPAWRNSSQARPSSAAESWRALRAACESARRIEQEEDEDREDGEAEDAAAVALLEGEGGEQAVGDFGAGDERQAEAGGEQDQHVDVAQRAAARRPRRRPAPTRASSPALRSAVSSAGKMPALEDHARPEDMAAEPAARADAGKRKDERHQHLVAPRGRQRGRADRGDERRSGSPARPAPTSGGARPSTTRPASAEERRAGSGRPGRRCVLIASPTPLLHIRPTLRAVIASVADRVFAEVLGEVFLADLAEGCVAGQVRVARRRPGRRAASGRPRRALRSRARGRGAR